MTVETKANILIVDDSPSELLAMSVALADMNQNIVTAMSGREALRQLLAQDFAVVLLDVNMPDMDGFETAALIRARPASAHVPIIFVTAYGDDTHAARGYSLGAVDYLLTPLVPEVLRAKVNVFVELYRRNIELQVQAEQRVTLAQEQLARRTAEAANRLKDEFLATLSHELRTPLNSILGWAQLLRMQKPGEDDLETGLEVIERCARAQAKLIEDLLDVSRIMSGKLVLDTRPARIADATNAAIESVRLEAEAKQVRIVRQFAGEPSAKIDAMRFQQAIWNLLCNAVKFTPEGGTITVSIDTRGDDVELCVADNGEGIAPEFLAHVFERFRQADASTARRHGGLGIGLAVVRQLIELHKGRVTVESAGLGKGARFRVVLPMVSVDPSAAPEPAQSTSNGASAMKLSGVRVLVVDDQVDARQWVRRVLTEAGAEVCEATSAIEAMKNLATDAPHVLVSDIGMPELDGYELIRRVRQRWTANELPALALTAYARSEERATALEKGFQLHLAKPVDAIDLIAAVTRLIGPRYSAAELQLSGQ